MSVEYSGMAAWIEKKRLAAVEAGNICKHCGGAIAKSTDYWYEYYHIVSFMTLCGFGRDTHAELKERDA